MSGATEADLYDLADTVVDKVLQFSPVFVSKADQLRESLGNLHNNIFAGIDEVQSQGK